MCKSEKLALFFKKSRIKIHLSCKSCLAVFVSIVVMGLGAGTVHSATTAVTYQVSAGTDDGYAWSATEQDIGSGYLMVGDDRTYTAPYYMSAMRFTNINAPRNAKIVDAHLKISSISEGFRGQIYGIIQAEAADDATDFSSRDIGAISKTTAAADWDHKDNWAANTYYTSPDISGVIQEVISRNGWNSGNAMAICYSTRADSGKSRMFGSFERGSGFFAAVLDITYETYSISGYVKKTYGTALSGVVVSAGADIESTTTDAGGYYELYIPPGWSGTVTPSKNDWGFNPASQTYSNVNSDQINQDYTGFQPKISGHIRTSDGVGIYGVTVVADNGGGTYKTNTTGFYTFTLPYGWSGNISLSRAGYTFVPPYRTYTNLTVDHTSENYIAEMQPIYVDINGTGDFTSVQEALDSAGSGHEIIILPGNYEEALYLFSGGKELTIRSVDPNNSEVIANTIVSIFQSSSSQTEKSSISGLTCRGIYGSGSEIRISNCVVRSSNQWGIFGCGDISNCLITDNAEHGIYRSRANISNCTISNNGRNGLFDCNAVITSCQIVSNEDCGLYLCRGEIVDCNISKNDNVAVWSFTGSISNCEIRNSNASGIINSSGSITECIISNNSGAGISNFNGPITGCTISKNRIYGLTDCDELISDCNISGNLGVGLRRCDGEVQNCRVTGNINNGDGGGFYKCDATIDNCIISSNTANYGGGLYDCDGPIFNCTIVGNSSKSGAVALCDGPIRNCIIWDNDPYGITQSYDCKYCCVQDAGAQGIGNFIADPLFLADGYHLSGYSPCIDGGEPNYIIDPNETDIDGDPRVVVRIDMGVDEFFGAEHALFHLSEKQFNFTALEDRSNPEPNSLIIRNYGLPDLDWSISEDCSWLQVNPSSGTIAFEGQAVVDVSVDITGMGAGDYNCVLIVADPEAENSPMSVEVHLEITGPELSIDVNEFNFQASKETLIPPEQFLTVTNATTGGTLNWNITKSDGCKWLIINPTSGSCITEPSIVSLSVDINNVNYGSYSCQFTVSDPNATNSPQILTVNLEVLRPELSISDSAFNFIAAGIDSDTATQILTIQNTGFDSLNWHIEMPNDCDWLKASPLTGQAEHLETDETILSIDHNNINYGIYSCQFSIVAPDAQNSPQYVDVDLEVLGPELTVSPLRFYFETALDEPNTAGQILSIQNTGYDTLHWDVNIPLGCGWLSASETSGQATSEVDEVILSIDHNNIERGFYQCEILISAPDVENSPQVIPVDLRVLGVKGQRYVPTEYPTIQAAVDAAVDGDEVIIEPGRYTGPGNYNIYFWGKAITVRSVAPNNPAIVAATIIEPNTIASVFIFHYYSGNQAGPVIDGLTIRLCIGRTAIHCYGGSPTIRNCIIEDNYHYDSQSYGGNGIECYDSNALISNCVIRNNQGGGLRCLRSDLTVSNCIFTGNRGSYPSYGGLFDISLGGGILFGGENISVINCTFSGNVADVGGGVCSYGYESDKYSIKMTISNCIFWENDANDGPQIALMNYQKEISPTVSVSYSDVQGGEAAVYVDPCCTLEWDNDNNLDIDPCFAVPGYWILAPSPPIPPPPPPPPPPYPQPVPSDDIWVDGDYHLKSQKGRWKPSIYIGLDPTRDNFINLLDFAAFANSWQKKGGSIPADLNCTGTVELSDLTLLLDNYLNSYTPGQWVLDNVTSPCIDAGDPNSDWTKELWPHGKRINMGAYGGIPEASMSLSHAGNIADLIPDGCVGYTDMMLLTYKWLYESVLLAEDLDRDGFVNFTDAAIFANNWQGTPAQASNPNPVDGAIGVDPNTDLSWTADHGVTSHDVYFGTSSPPPFVCNQTSTTFDPGTMAYGTKYYWRIEEVNSGWASTGTVWSFRTYGSPPPPPL